MAQIIELTPQEVSDKLNKQEIKLIDIREGIEHKEEYIEGSELKSLSAFDERKGSEEHDTSSITYVYYCRSGNRTKQFAQRLIALYCMRDIHILKGGIIAWKEKGFKTIKSENIKFSLMQQVQIIAGSLILLGVLLSIFVNYNFIYLSAFVGAGLLLAGLTGNCPMAVLLGKAPWNK